MNEEFRNDIYFHKTQFDKNQLEDLKSYNYNVDLLISGRWFYYDKIEKMSNWEEFDSSFYSPPSKITFDRSKHNYEIIKNGFIYEEDSFELTMIDEHAIYVRKDHNDSLIKMIYLDSLTWNMNN